MPCGSINLGLDPWSLVHQESSKTVGQISKLLVSLILPKVNKQNIYLYKCMHTESSSLSTNYLIGITRAGG